MCRVGAAWEWVRRGAAEFRGLVSRGRRGIIFRERMFRCRREAVWGAESAARPVLEEFRKSAVPQLRGTARWAMAVPAVGLPVRRRCRAVRSGADMPSLAATVATPSASRSVRPVAGADRRPGCPAPRPDRQGHPSPGAQVRACRGKELSVSRVDRGQEERATARRASQPARPMAAGRLQAAEWKRMPRSTHWRLVSRTASGRRSAIRTTRRPTGRRRMLRRALRAARCWCKAAAAAADRAGRSIRLRRR